MKRVGFIVKRSKPEAIDLVLSLAATLAARNIRTVAVSDLVDAMADRSLIDAQSIELVAEEALAKEIDLLVVLGGDGTLLHGASLVSDLGVPVLGVNLGRLGFLTSCDPAEALEAVTAALHGDLRCENRMRLCAVLVKSDGQRESHAVVNDVVISQSQMARLIELEVSVDDALVTAYRADGLIVSTPTGSTAYNLSAGGPIVAPSVDAMIVSPICPHTLSLRPLVLSAASRLVIRTAGQMTEAAVTWDGQRALTMVPGDHLEISRAEQPLRLFAPSKRSGFDILRSKLRWG